MSITIKWIFKMTAREYHNQYDCDGVSQLKEIPWSITIKMTAREYNKLLLSGIYNNTNDCK